MGVLTAVLPARARARARLVSWWWRVLAIYLASRVVTTLILVLFAAQQGQNPWTGPSPGYFDYASIWDGRWYDIISQLGYPSVLPLTAEGHVGESAWAFMPVYPGVVVGVMFLTGLSWGPAAVLVSVLAGAGAAIGFCALMRRFLSERDALFATALLCVSPVSPLFQLAYAESLQIFLLTLALLLLVDRRYVWLFPVVLLLGFTRPSGLAFALAMGFHLLARWSVRHTTPFPPRERLLSIAVAVWSGLVGFAWPAIAWLVTGSMTAYTDTELAWRSAYIGYQHLVPFAAWFQGANWWFGSPLGAIIVIALVLIFILVLTSRRVATIGLDLRLWAAAYGIYLLAVFFPQSSTFRLLMPMFPLLGAFATIRQDWARAVLVLLGIAGQIVWIAMCWGVDGSDWTPP